MNGDEADKAKAAAAGGGDYGTFQKPPSYPPPRPPAVPPHSRPRGSYHNALPHDRDYEAGVRGHSHHRLPCCGIGIGWFLFIIGFFFGGIPWYVGAFLLWCSRVDYREKPGYVACTIAAVLSTIAVIIGASAGAHVY